MSVMIGPYEIERGEIAPASRKYQTPQSAVIAEDGIAHVAEGLYKERFFNMKLIDLLPAIEDVIYYIENGVRYSAIPFLLIDGFGITRLVRYWSGTLEPVYPGAGLAELNLTFREEIS